MNNVSLVNVDNKTLQTIAMKKAEQETNYSKKQKIYRGMILATPVAVGIATATLSPKYLGQAVVNSKTTQALIDKGLPIIKGASARLINGAKGFLENAAYLGFGMLGFNALDKLGEKSEKVDNFNKKHGFLSTLAVVAATFATIGGAKKGLGALVAKLKPETFKTLAQKTRNFNKTEFISKLSEKTNRLAGKMGDNTKGALKTLLNWTPTALILGGFFGHLTNNLKYANHATQNYQELKELQYQQAMAEVNGTI